MHFICCENTFIPNLVIMKLISICCSSSDPFTIIQHICIKVNCFYIFVFYPMVAEPLTRYCNCMQDGNYLVSFFILANLQKFEFNIAIHFMCQKDKRKQQHARVKLAYFIVNTDGQRPVVKLRIG